MYFALDDEVQTDTRSDDIDRTGVIQEEALGTRTEEKISLGRLHGRNKFLLIR